MSVHSFDAEDGREEIAQAEPKGIGRLGKGLAKARKAILGGVGDIIDDLETLTARSPGHEDPARATPGREEDPATGESMPQDPS